MALTLENYNKGFLVDEELMGGITESPEHPGSYAAYVLQHTTGEYLGYQVFPDLQQALDALSRVQRNWKFESVSGCGNGKCAGDRCKVGGCGKKLADAFGLAGATPQEPCESGNCPT